MISSLFNRISGILLRQKFFVLVEFRCFDMSDAPGFRLPVMMTTKFHFFSGCMIRNAKTKSGAEENLWQFVTRIQRRLGTIFIANVRCGECVIKFRATPFTIGPVRTFQYIPTIRPDHAILLIPIFGSTELRFASTQCGFTHSLALAFAAVIGGTRRVVADTCSVPDY